MPRSTGDPEDDQTFVRRVLYEESSSDSSDSSGSDLSSDAGSDGDNESSDGSLVENVVDNPNLNQSVEEEQVGDASQDPETDEEAEAEDDPSQYAPANEDGTYTVEKIVDKGLKDGQMAYKVKWAGWPESYNSFELIDDLGVGAFEAIYDYEREQAKKRRADPSIIAAERRCVVPRKIIDADIKALLADKKKRIEKILQMWCGDRMAGTVNSYAIRWEDGRVYEVDQNWVAELEGENRELFVAFHQQHHDAILEIKEKCAKENLALARRLAEEDRTRTKKVK